MRRVIGLFAACALVMVPWAVTDAAPSDQIDSVGVGGATATAVAVRSDPPQPPPSGGGRFSTLAPGSVLPTDQACAQGVRPTAEIRTINATANATPGVGANSVYPRVTGNFTGTTDEILQWVACKWGIDEDVVRAQLAKESWWHQDAGGDFTTDQSKCHPLVRTSSGPCPEAVGLGQVRYQYHPSAFDNANAVLSSAYNLDYTYAVWRSCFEGEVTWLNTVERGRDYVAGDMWGCVGVWFAGRWYTPPATTYIDAVHELLDQKVWQSSDFPGG